MEPARILVIDDEEVIRDSCRQILLRCRYAVETAQDAFEALGVLRRTRIDLVLLDLKMPGMDGTELLRKIREELPALDVIVITGYSSVGSAVDCMRLGAYDYLAKPFDAGSLRIVVGRALEKRRLALENEALRRTLREESAPDVLLGACPAILRVREMVARVGPSDSTVLILGESGTGKELVARALHRASARRDQPFVTVDCGALVPSLCESELFGHVKGAFTGAVSSRPGRFEQAHRGSIFLDEIGNIGPTLQGKLLRVLQEREATRVGGTAPTSVDVRVIAATNRDLRAARAAGRFREDLFYRLSVVVVEIPPLRARREDIPLLAEGLLQRLCERKHLPPRRLSNEALLALSAHDWPGNVRELENVLERVLVLGGDAVIRGADLVACAGESPPAAPEGDGGRASTDTLARMAAVASTRLPSNENGHDAGARDSARAEPDPDRGGEATEDLTLARQEEVHIRRVLEMSSWHLSRTARVLGIDRKTLWRKLKSYGLK